MILLKMITSGESHGKYLIGVIEGIPGGFPLDSQYINDFLKRRQKGYGRGKRMSMEEDKVEIVGGVWKGKTTGAPISLFIENKGARSQEKEPQRTIPRPGHADFAGAVKYEFFDDFNPVIERASARETAMRVALGAITHKFLHEMGIETVGYVRGIFSEDFPYRGDSPEELRMLRDSSPLLMVDENGTDICIEIIDKISNLGYTLGGKIEVIVFSPPPGLGSYVSYDKRLDAKFSEILMSIPSVKAVEIGEGIKSSQMPGGEAIDHFRMVRYGIKRSTNFAGGIEGGISNGENIRINLYLKPIPTQENPLPSFDFKDGKPTPAPYIRSDRVVVPAASVIAEALTAFVVSDVFLERFGGDTFSMVKKHYEGWLKEWKKILSSWE